MSANHQCTMITIIFPLLFFFIKNINNLSLMSANHQRTITLTKITKSSRCNRLSAIKADIKIIMIAIKFIMIIFLCLKTPPPFERQDRGYLWCDLPTHGSAGPRPNHSMAMMITIKNVSMISMRVKMTMTTFSRYPLLMRTSCTVTFVPAVANT